MDEKDQTEQQPRYVWPRVVLGMVLLGIVLAIFWMSALVIQVRERRANDPRAYTNGPVSIWSAQTQSSFHPAPLKPVVSTNAAPATNSFPPKSEPNR